MSGPAGHPRELSETPVSRGDESGTDDLDAPTSEAADLGRLLEAGEAERSRILTALARSDPARAARLSRRLRRDRDADDSLERLRCFVAERSMALLAAGEPAAPERLGAWTLVERLGSGGMGEVWLGRRVEGGFEQTAAIKIVRAGMNSDGIVARFLLERQVLARLEHPAIARLFDGGVAADGRPWFAMERVDGEPIVDWVRIRGCDLERRLELFVEVCEAVDFAHRNLIVHRDLKPSNLLVTRDGRPKLLDFGLAKMLEDDGDSALTRAETRALTPAYAAPEQVLGEPITTATDVHALGVLLYELLTGTLPHRRQARTPAALAEEVRGEVIEPPSIRVRRAAGADVVASARAARRLSGDLDVVVATALHREPASRYRSAAALADDVRCHLEHRPIAARAESRFVRGSRFVRRHRFAVAAATVAVASLVLGLSTSLVSASRARREAQQAARARDFLASLFGGVDPDSGPGPEAPARLLLELGERRIDAELRDEPRLAGDLYDALARASLVLGALEPAGRQAARGRQLRAAAHGEDSLPAAVSLATEGAVATARGDHELGERQLRESLAAVVGRAGDDSPEAALVRVELAANLSRQLRAEEAIPLRADAERTLLAALGPADPRRLRNLTALASAHVERGEIGIADALFGRADAELERDGATPVTRALFEVERWSLLWAQHRPREALAAAERSLSDLERLLGAEHELLARPLQMRAMTRMALGDFGGVREDLDRAAGILTRIDTDHPALLGVLFDRATIDQHSGRVDEAIATRRRLVESAIRRFGPESSQAIEQIGGLAATLAVAPSGREEALRIYRDIFELAAARPEALRPEDHAAFARAFVHRLLIDRRDADEAIGVLAPTVARLAHADPAFRDQHLVDLRVLLARALADRGAPGDFDRAWREAEQALAEARSRRVRLVQEPALLLGELDLRQGRSSAAEARVAAWLAAQPPAAEGSGPLRHGDMRRQIQLAEARLLLARALVARGARSEAGTALEWAFETFSRRLGPDHPSTRRARAELERFGNGGG
jgi:serine/threonine-protein kinase